MGHFSTAKTERDLDLVALFEKPPDGAKLHVIVMIIDAGPHLDLFQLDDFLVLARFGCFFLFLEFEFSKIKNFAYRRFGVRRNLYEIEADTLSAGKGIKFCDDADILSGLVDEAAFPGP